MSQSLQFYKFKPYNPEFSVLSSNSQFPINHIKESLKNKNLDDDKQLNSVMEDVKTKFLIYIAENDLIYPLLTETGNPRLLYEDPPFYFVDEKLWSAIKATLLKEIENNSDSLNNKNQTYRPPTIQELYDLHLKFDNIKNLESLVEECLLLTLVC